MTDTRSQESRLTIDADYLLEVLTALVDCPSPTGNEADVASVFAGYLEKAGAESGVQQVDKNRANAVAQVTGSGGGRDLLLSGHLDTSYSGAEPGLDAPGFQPRAQVVDGHVVGLGVWNMKAGLAAAAAATKAVTDSGVMLRGDLIVAGVAGEIEKVEVGESRGRAFRGYGVGTEHLVKHGQLADAAIIGEPTGFQVSTGHLGALWLELTVFGDFQHTARSFVPGFRHAVHAALPALVGLQQWVAEYNQRTVYKGATCVANIAAIRAGDAWRASRTPQECRIFIDIRYEPSRSAMEVRDELESIVGGILGPSGSGSWTMKPYLSAPPAEIASDEILVTELQRIATGVIGEEVSLGFQGPMNDAGTLINAGIPAVCFGVPTTSKEFRSQHAGESVRIADVAALAEVYAKFALTFCA